MIMRARFRLEKKGVDKPCLRLTAVVSAEKVLNAC